MVIQWKPEIDVQLQTFILSNDSADHSYPYEDSGNQLVGQAHFIRACPVVMLQRLLSGPTEMGEGIIQSLHYPYIAVPLYHYS